MVFNTKVVFFNEVQKTHKKTANEQPHSPKNLKLKEVFILATP